MRLHLSTAYHPQIDGLSERAVQTLKQYLRIFCHDQQHTWMTYLLAVTRPRALEMHRLRRLLGGSDKGVYILQTRVYTLEKDVRELREEVRANATTLAKVPNYLEM